MVTKRSKLELYLEVLKAVSRGVSKPTNIMYKCNLSWANCKEILNFLVERGFITVTENNNHRLYKLTENGRELLKILSKMQDLLMACKRREAPYAFDEILTFLK